MKDYLPHIGALLAELAIALGAWAFLIALASALLGGTQ